MVLIKSCLHRKPESDSSSRLFIIEAYRFSKRCLDIPWFALIVALVSIFTQKTTEALASEKRSPVEASARARRKWLVHGAFGVMGKTPLT